MSETITLAPTWVFAVQIYAEVLQSVGANPEIKRQAVRDMTELAKSYERLAVKLTEQTAEIERLKTRIHDLLEEQNEAEAKARIQSAQMELLQDSVEARGVRYDFPSILSTEQERDD